MSQCRFSTIAALLSLAILPVGFAAADLFLPGDLVVERIGAGSVALDSTGTASFVDEFQPSGTGQNALHTVAMPTTSNGNNHKLVNSGSAASEGLLSLSQDGRYLALVGYDAAVGASGVKSTTARTIARVDASGNVDTTTSGLLGGNDNARGVSTKDGSAFWFTQAVGVNYITFGTSPTITSLSTQNSRASLVSGNQVYISSSSGTNTKGVLTLGNGLPISGTQTLTRLSGESDTLTPNSYQFAFVDRDATVVGNDTLYIADNTNGILKYSFDGSAWTAHGTISGSFTGLAAAKNGTSADIFVTTAAGDKLQKLTDTASFNAAISGSLTTLATAPTNEVFRGVAFAPVPEASSILFGGLMCGVFGLTYGVRLLRRKVARTSAT
jgi:hypothetical protein